MLGRRRVFAVEPRGGPGMLGALGRPRSLILTLLADRAAEDPARGCVVPGVSSTYRRIPDAAGGASPPWNAEAQLRGPGRRVPLLKLASRDSGVEMAVGDSSLVTSPGLSLDSLDFDPSGSSEAPALVEPPAQLGRLLASRTLEQVLERSRCHPSCPASWSQQHRPLQPPSKPACELPALGGGEQETTGSEKDLEAAEGVRALEPEVWTSLPGQGLRYLEHLCLVLEQMARLQQLHLQLQTWRPAGSQDPGEESPAPAPSLSPSPALSNEAQVPPWDLPSQTKDAGAKATSSPKVGVPGTDLAHLSEASEVPAHTFPPSQGHKVKVLLNRIFWRNSRHPEPLVPRAGPDLRIESRDLPERSQCHPRRKTFMPSLVVRKQRAKNLSVC
ncbi:uncharacterized protein C8orf58 homolog [Echinops telfairi]|uniref:Uncharacterized protein C8orf58 homolog n=1 Tax=Echinops telfairi TaxID=9371 RepID=A0AC55CTF6_ECHTE|nr:uncharacterized protein C8orf58 homolog [Echinops telfairi]